MEPSGIKVFFLKHYVQPVDIDPLQRFRTAIYMIHRPYSGSCADAPYDRNRNRQEPIR